MVSELIARQRAFYQSGTTRDYAFRTAALDRLREAVLSGEEELNRALASDLNKSPCESYLCEIGTVLDELRYHRKHLRRWMRPRRVSSAVGQLPGRCIRSPEPYGTVLVFAPWNYPVHLSLMPLIGAISAGNTAVVKLSETAPATAQVIAELIGKTFPPEYIAAIEGGREQDRALLRERVDYIFYTGSVNAGREVMAAAARHLTPVTLELGGKSPVIVDDSADISLAARRIAFGKVMNAGQTCVAPDYLLIHESVRESFLENYRKALTAFFPEGDTGQMVIIVSRRQYERLKTLMGEGRIVIGGGCDDEQRRIEPTVIDQLHPDAAVMGEEIFGPILPLFSYHDLGECVDFINGREKPLALYLFSRRRETVRRVLDSCSFGGGCVNDTILHLANPRLPFGGVGASGMGNYHGKASFDTFTHWRSILIQRGKMDIPLRYPPSSEKKLALLRKVMR